MRNGASGARYGLDRFPRFCGKSVATFIAIYVVEVRCNTFAFQAELFDPALQMRDGFGAIVPTALHKK